ncbi:hypothetical protein LINGRAHAP2_LOCUS16736 [Linum grandiflorum]
MEWTRSIGFSRIIFETDSLAACQAIESCHSDTTEKGCIAHLCHSFLSCNPSCKVVFVRRCRNRTAHELVRRSHFSASPHRGVPIPDWL